MTRVVEVRNLRKTFEGRLRHVEALRGINLTTEEGEYLVLLGPSGCGKTTLLRTIAGLEQATEGDVLIGGHVVNGLPPRARQIAMVFQSYALYPHKTVLANIEFPLKAERMERGSREAKVRWAAGLLGIEHLLDRKPRELSGVNGSGRAGPGPGARAPGLPARRAAVQPGREAARVGARRTEAVPAAGRHHHRLRHA